MTAPHSIRTVWLVRHGMRQDFEQDDWQATAERPHDPPLSASGRLQAGETGLFLRDKGLDRIYCSPFLRTVETAAIIAEACDVPVCIEHGLGEVLKAEWFPREPDFIPPKILKQQFPSIDPAYRPRVRPHFPEDEESGELDARCQKAVDTLLADDWSCALWVGHGASVGGMARGLTGDMDGVCFEMCGLTGWTGTTGDWRRIYGGTEHLSVTDESLRFH